MAYIVACGERGGMRRPFLFVSNFVYARPASDWAFFAESDVNEYN